MKYHVYSTVTEYYACTANYDFQKAGDVCGMWGWKNDALPFPSGKDAQLWIDRFVAAGGLADGLTVIPATITTVVKYALKWHADGEWLDNRDGDGVAPWTSDKSKRHLFDTKSAALLEKSNYPSRDVALIRVKVSA